MEKNFLFSSARLDCRCASAEQTKRLEKLLNRAESLLNDGKTRQSVLVMQEAFRLTKDIQKTHLQFNANFARDMVDLAKVRALNVGPNQNKVRTVPFLTGKDKRDHEIQAEEKKKTKRRKKK